MAKPPFLPGMGAGGGKAPGGGGFGGGIPGGAGLKPGSAPKGKPGAKKGMPNFKSRITKPGGMKSGGVVKAGQGSGVGRLQRSK